MRIALAAEHGDFELKEFLAKTLRDLGYEVLDLGTSALNTEDDYPDFVVPLAKAVSDSKVERGVAICGRGVGACVVANKIVGVRARALIHETFSAHQGVEDDNINMICLGGLVVCHAFAWELVKMFLQAEFSSAGRFQRRQTKVTTLEHKKAKS